MKYIQVSSLPLKDVISDMAREFDTTFTENCSEYELILPSHIGSGYIRGINFEVGLGLLMYNCTFNIDLELRFIVDKIHPLKFLHICNGQLTHRFEKSDELHVIEQYQNAIVSSSDNHGHILYFKQGVRTSVNSIEIDRAKFEEKINCYSENLGLGLKELFSEEKTTTSFYHKGYFSLKTSDLYAEIDQYEEKNIVRRLFLEGITYQVLTQEILEFIDDKKEEGTRNVLRKYEVAQIKNASDYIQKNINGPLTVEELAKEAGLNVNKLQQGFKILYGDTVNRYVQKARFKLSKDLMLNTDYNISEIVSRIGLTSKSYFSKIFKEEYGISPSEFRDKNTNVLASQKTSEIN